MAGEPWRGSKEFGDYIVYVDESDNRSLTSIDEKIPVFYLAFVCLAKGHSSWRPPSPWSATKPGMPCFEIVFATKIANSTGLQIADLIPRPIALHAPSGERAFDAIRAKILAIKAFP